MDESALWGKIPQGKSAVPLWYTTRIFPLWETQRVGASSPHIQNGEMMMLTWSTHLPSNAQMSAAEHVFVSQ